MLATRFCHRHQFHLDLGETRKARRLDAKLNLLSPMIFFPSFSPTGKVAECYSTVMSLRSQVVLSGEANVLRQPTIDAWYPRAAALTEGGGGRQLLENLKLRPWQRPKVCPNNPGLVELVVAWYRCHEPLRTRIVDVPSPFAMLPTVGRVHVRFHAAAHMERPP